MNDKSGNDVSAHSADIKKAVAELPANRVGYYSDALLFEGQEMAVEINGKVYDTGKADTIARWDIGCCGADFCWCGEYLYQTPEGEFFLVGNGGLALREYASADGKIDVRWGCRFVVLTTQEAESWRESRAHLFHPNRESGEFQK